jgi:hypothetical protein
LQALTRQKNHCGSCGCEGQWVLTVLPDAAMGRGSLRAYRCDGLCGQPLVLLDCSRIDSELGD